MDEGFDFLHGAEPLVPIMKHVNITSSWIIGDSVNYDDLIGANVSVVAI